MDRPDVARRVRPLVDRLTNLRALLVVTCRPEFAAPWVGGAHVASLPLSRFGADSLAMVDRVTGGRALPAEVLEQIVAKTDGVPLFVEELTQAVLEFGSLRAEDGAYVLASALIPLVIPSTLQDSLMARLDRLAPVKEIAQIAAAIGREFSYRLLEAAAPIQGPALQSALGQLMAAELIHGRGSPPEATYVFKHALVQDAAYASLLHSRRQRIHADIARAMQELFADQIEATPAIVAHHYAERASTILRSNGGARRAIRRCAARPSRRRSPISARRSTADKAGPAALQAPGNSAPPSQRLSRLHVAYGNALIAARGYAAPETRQAFARARESAPGDKDAPERLAADYGLWASSYVRGDLPSMRALAAAFLSDIGARPDSPEGGVAHRAAGITCWFAGDYREARDHFEERSPCSNPAATTIWPFASAWTTVSSRCPIWRLRHGRSAKSVARFRSSPE